MRYLPHTDEDRKAMLAAIGVNSIDDLFVDVPPQARLLGTVELPKRKTEQEVERLLSKMAAKNVPASDVPFFVGAGAYKHHVPATVDHLIQRSEFLTSYTPYQPEISQGTLQYLFEFQTQVSLITGMDVANASMYDGSTGCGEAVLMAERITKRKKSILSGGLHPHYCKVVQNLAKFGGSECVTLSPSTNDGDVCSGRIDETTACIVVQNPNVFGELIDLGPIAEAAHRNGALLIAVVTEIISLGAIKSPGDSGADIVVAEGQSLGVGLNFGGPYLGLFATREKYLRQMPGRICGQTADADGRRGFVLTLSSREQHIRREKATSNICTNSGLCCLAFTIHLSLLGERGLTSLAAINHHNACALADVLSEVDGVEVLNERFFNEFTIRTPQPSVDVIEKLASKGVLGGVPVSRLLPDHPDLSNLIIVAATEVNSDDDRETYRDRLSEILT
ncbi:glycine dehydrogenase subunit 1 [Rhodoligotrophos appendicifer]|uniref:aminomethyl-transferring glycine dehydrogenase subunit GcvPA n=1 Tax=Rhodoligotrophos appendicifer TaxID=987056 RepID=UPI0011867E03|nr:aminomethyl-transferring glycine dehydrogenase subunit GcvPA [Rhodoligotrophos appendicifer]